MDSKLRDLGAEKARLQARLDALHAAPYKPIDPDAVLRAGVAALANLERLLDAGTIEERKEFIRAFVAGVTVVPEDARLDLQIRKLPATLPQPGDSTCLMVAGARFEPATPAPSP